MEKKNLLSRLGDTVSAVKKTVKTTKADGG
jgi:hypothetical protein